MGNSKILYNVTIIIDHSVHDEWLEWMKVDHIPEVMNTGKFESYKMTKIIEDHNPDGVTYAVQYIAFHFEAYDTYQKDHAPILQKKTQEKYNGKYAAFRTCMEVISEG